MAASLSELGNEPAYKRRRTGEPLDMQSTTTQTAYSAASTHDVDVNSPDFQVSDYLSPEEAWLWRCLKELSESAADAPSQEFKRFDDLRQSLHLILGLMSGQMETQAKADADESAATSASSAEPEKYVWLDFRSTAIRSDLKSEIIQKVSQLYRSNRFFRNSLEPYTNVLTEQLVALVLKGMESEAEAVIKACPFLLERSATVTDSVGRVYENVTAYEAALYAGDTQMCEMMHPFFERLGDRGEAMRLAQCDNVFPDGVEDAYNAQEPYDFNELVNAIDQASDNEVREQLEKKETDTELGIVIKRFRADFASLSKQERLANPKHLLEAYRVFGCDERIRQWTQCKMQMDPRGTPNKLYIFEDQVFGFVQGYLPECDKQAFYQGMKSIVEGSEPRVRLSEFKYCDDERRGFRSLSFSAPFSGIGFDEPNLSSMASHGSIAAGEAGPNYNRRLFKELHHTKILKLKSLCSSKQALGNHA